MRVRYTIVLFALALSPDSELWGQPGTVTTIAGQFPLGDGGPAMNAAFYAPGSLARDSKGNIYVLETNRLRKIAPDGVITTYAGTGLDFGALGDGGPASRANLRSRSWNAVVADAESNLYIADDGNQRIRKISADGIITTVAGTGNASFSGDGGPATEARLISPRFLALERDGGLVFVDNGNNRLRRIRQDGTMETLAGNGVRAATNPEGTPAIESPIDQFRGVAIDAEQRILFADNSRVLTITPDGNLAIVAGGGTSRADGVPATEVNLTTIYWIAVDPLGNLWISNNTTMRRIPQGGTIETVVGGGDRLATSLTPGERVPARSVRLAASGQPLWLSENEFLFSEADGQSIYRYGPDGMVERFAGTPADAGASGPSQFARLTAPMDLLIDPDGTLQVLEERSLRYVDPSGVFRTRWAGFGLATGMAMEPTGDLLVAHNTSNTISRTSQSTNIWFRVAGIALLTGYPPGFSGDGGPASQARLNGSQGVAADADGNIFIAETPEHRLRKIDAGGIITTIAGTGLPGFEGDGGPAVNARFASPRDVIVSNGTLFITDTGNRRIRTIDPTGIVRTFVEPSAWFGNGLPNRLALAPDGSLIVTDTAHRIHRVSPQGVVRVIGGTGMPGSSGDGGPSTAAAFNNPNGVTVDANGNIYIADTGNNRIRMIRGITTVRAEPRSFVFAYALGAPAVSQTLTLFSGDDDATQYRVTTNVPWLVVTPSSGELTAPSVAIRVTASPAGLGRGAYQGRITILNVDKGDSYEVPVSMIVSGTPQQLRLDRSGVTFASMANGATLTQTLRVLNTGTGAMPWTALGSTTSGGAWLRVTPGSGQSNAGATAPALNVSVDPTGLVPGAYFGLVTVNAPNVDNAPQSAVVVLNVFPNDAPPGAQVSPYGMVFTTPPEGRPANQTISLSNPSNRALTYTATLAFPDTRRWFTLSSTTGTIAAGQSVALTVTPAVTGIPAGVYRGTVQLRFAPDNTTQTVDLILVVAAGSVLSTSSVGPRANGCIPRRLVPLFRAPGAGFRVTAGWPEAVEVLVADDCGDPVNSGRVAITFSTNDPPLQLTSVGNGRWTGAWTARTIRASNVAMVANVQSASPTLEARVQITGGVVENRLQPLIDTGGVVSLASLKREQPVATNSLIAVLGTRLSGENQEAPSTPWPTELLDTRAFVAGRPIPLRRTSEGRIEALLPLGVPEFTTHQMIVQRGRSYSPPESVLVTATSPAVFTADESGSDQGSVYIRDADGRRKLASAERPATAGDIVEIEATGLGMTDPVVPPGQSAPEDGARVTSTVEVTIGGKPAEVQEAMLMPGTVGMYLVKAVVPDGLETSTATPLVLTVDGQPSPPVTVATRAR